MNGELPVREMGITLIHEHVLVDFIGADSTGYHRWDRSEVVARALPFLLEAKERGVKTLFECTPAYVGRDPLLLRELSEKSGLNIVTNTGYYGAGNNRFIPSSALEAGPDEMAKVWINEFKNGIEGTGIFPGFIKMAVDGGDTLSSMHVNLVRAAAITHKETGLTIVSHTGADGPARAQLQILKEEGVSADAFVWTHAQGGTVEGYINAARQGAWISLDNVNHANADKPGGIDWLVPVLKKMKDERLLHKVLISHDAGWYHVGQENGGDYRGYIDIFDYLVPALTDHGFSQEEIDLLLMQNPQRAYAVNIRTMEAP
ncbi:MAG: hypothetical protein R2834_03920 [Rhodothermales bacterium]